jgi:hypothetical protein
MLSILVLVKLPVPVDFLDKLELDPSPVAFLLEDVSGIELVKLLAVSIRVDTVLVVELDWLEEVSFSVVGLALAELELRPDPVAFLVVEISSVDPVLLLPAEDFLLEALECSEVVERVVLDPSVPVSVTTPVEGSWAVVFKVEDSSGADPVPEAFLLEVALPEEVERIPVPLVFLVGDVMPAVPDSEVNIERLVTDVPVLMETGSTPVTDKLFVEVPEFIEPRLEDSFVEEKSFVELLSTTEPEDLRVDELVPTEVVALRDPDPESVDFERVEAVVCSDTILSLSVD